MSFTFRIVRTLEYEGWSLALAWVPEYPGSLESIYGSPLPKLHSLGSEVSVLLPVCGGDSGGAKGGACSGFDLC